MNDKDRQEIADVLDGLTTDDTITIINSGTRLLERHPKILDWMSEKAVLWWGVEKPKDKDEP